MPYQQPKPKPTLAPYFKKPLPTPQPTSPKWLKRLGIGTAIGGGLLGATMLWNNMRRMNKNNQKRDG
ncbi:MAG: hypothetical protein P3W91_003045 [Fervidobacterium sp.]|nr:hypothetical protein [Fervidobacterium sp.]